jgi:hypothetical protein
VIVRWFNCTITILLYKNIKVYTGGADSQSWADPSVTVISTGSPPHPDAYPITTRGAIIGRRSVVYNIFYKH